MLQCPPGALSALFRRGGFRHVRPNRDSTKKGHAGAADRTCHTSTHRRTEARHVLASGVECCNIHLVQHDNLCPINIIRLPNSESRISDQVIAAKLRTVVTLNSLQVIVR